MGKNNAIIIDEALWKAAGIDRKTGLPLKARGIMGPELESEIRILFRVKDEQQAVNRYKWNIPKVMNITGQELERFLYYKGQLCFFSVKLKDQIGYFITPYALDGTIDIYGRFNHVKAVPFASGIEYKKGSDAEKSYNNLVALLSLKKLRVVRFKDEKVEEIDKENVCVLIHDYTKQLSEQIIPRQQLQEPIIKVMSLTIPYLRTNMLASTGIKGMRVGDTDQYRQVIEGAASVDSFAKSGQIWYPFIGTMEFQELTEKNMAAMNDYMQTLQSLDNLRLSAYGIENGGVFEKKAHVLGQEEQINNSNTDLVYMDGLEIRKNFCDLVNSIWNIGISVEENKETIKNTFGNVESGKMKGKGEEDEDTEL